MKTPTKEKRPGRKDDRGAQSATCKESADDDSSDVAAKVNDTELERLASKLDDLRGQLNDWRREAQQRELDAGRGYADMSSYAGRLETGLMFAERRLHRIAEKARRVAGGAQ